MIPTYEEEFGPFERQLRRVWRMLRWRLKGLTGRPRHILIELNWRLGDEIMALPVLAGIHGRYPADVLHVRTNYPALFDDHPYIRVSACLPPIVDRYILLRGASRKKYRLAEYAAHAGVPVPESRPSIRYLDWTVPAHLETPGGDGPAIVLAGGASWPSKRWLPDRWETLADALRERGCRLVVMGQHGEYVGRGMDLTGKTSVSDAARVLHAADLAICCDSGLMHLALAVETPVVALFGPTDPDILVQDEPRFFPIRSTEPCSGYWNHAGQVGAPGECPYGHACCLESISVDRVLAAVTDQLAERGP